MRPASYTSLCLTVFPLKPLHTATGVDDFLDAGEERVALRAYFYTETFLSGCHTINLAAGASNRSLFIFRMNLGLQRIHLFQAVHLINRPNALRQRQLYHWAGVVTSKPVERRPSSEFRMVIAERTAKRIVLPR